MATDAEFDMEATEHSIWLTAYIRALAGLAPSEAAALADEAIEQYSARWTISAPDGEDPTNFRNFLDAVARSDARKIARAQRRQVGGVAGSDAGAPEA